MRPRVRCEKFVVISETLAQVGREPVIDRTAVRIVRVHITEGNASCKTGWVGVIVEGRGGIKGGVKILNKSGKNCGQRRAASNRTHEVCDRRIISTRTEKVRQCRRNPWQPGVGIHSARGRTGSNLQRTSRGVRSRIAIRRLPIRDQQVSSNRVGVNWTVQVPSAVEVVSEAQRKASAQIALNRHIRLLRIRIDKVLRLRITERLEGQRKRGAAKLSRRIRQVLLLQEQRLV